MLHDSYDGGEGGEESLIASRSQASLYNQGMVGENLDGERPRTTSSMNRPRTTSSMNRPRTTSTSGRPQTAHDGLLVSISSTGLISSVMKSVEDSNTLSKPAYFFDVSEHLLTDTLRADRVVGNGNNCATVEGYERDKQKKKENMETRKKYRKDVYETKVKILQNNQKRVLEKINAHELKREEERAQRKENDRAMVFLPFVSTIKFATSLIPKLLIQRRVRIKEAMRNESATKIQNAWKSHFASRMLRLVLAFKNLGLGFSIKVRIRRKHKAADLLQKFLYKVKSEAYPSIIKAFVYSVKKAQRSSKQFVECQRARKEVMNKMWLKLEMTIRSEFAVKAKAIAAANQKLLDNNPDMVDTQYRFAAAKSKVSRLLIKTKELNTVRIEKFGAIETHRTANHTVDSKLAGERKSSKSTKSLLALSENEEINSSTSGGITQHRTSISQHKKRDPNSITLDLHTREQIIAAELTNFRKAYMVHTNNFVASVRNKVVDSSIAKRLLLAEAEEKGTESKELQALAADMMTTKVFVKPTFKLFTASYGGKTWRSIIEEAVKKDIIIQKRNAPKLEFRPCGHLIARSEERVRLREVETRKKGVSVHHSRVVVVEHGVSSKIGYSTGKRLAPF